jgi:predicted SnoaL-like aldol condensation-catalyzing enzyme
MRIAILVMAAALGACAPAANTNGEGGMSRTAEEERNLALVMEMYQNVLIAMDADRVDDYIPEDYIQHSQFAPPGREALKDFLRMIRAESPDAEQMIKRTLVDGNMVAVHLHVKRFPDDPGLAVVDLFRVEDGKVQEHWEVIQDVPTDPINPMTMFEDGR